MTTLSRQEVKEVNINLTPELEQLVQSKVQSGRYNSANEVVRDALRLMDQYDRLETFRKEEISKKIAQGLESLRLGKGVDGEAVFDRIEAELAELERHDHQ